MKEAEEAEAPKEAEAFSKLEEFIEPAGLKGPARVLYWAYWILGVGTGISTGVVIILHYV